MKLAFLGCLLFLVMVVMVMVGCTSPAGYQSVPSWLVPLKPVVPTVLAADIKCLSDDAYNRLAERDRACWQHVRELRAVIGVTP